MMRGIGNIHTTNTTNPLHLQYAMSAPTTLNLQHMLSFHSNGNSCGGGGMNNSIFLTNQSSTVTNLTVIQPSCKSSFVLLEESNNKTEIHGDAQQGQVNGSVNNDANRFLRNNGNNSMSLDGHDSGLDDILNHVDWNRLIEEEMVGGNVVSSYSKRQSCPNLNMKASLDVTSLLMSNNTNEKITNTILNMDTNNTNNDPWSSYFDSPNAQHQPSLNNGYETTVSSMNIDGKAITNSSEVLTSNNTSTTCRSDDKKNITESSSSIACGKQNPLLALWQKNVNEKMMTNNSSVFDHQRMPMQSNEMDDNIHRSNSNNTIIDRQQINNGTVIVDNTIDANDEVNNIKLFEDLMHITDLWVVNRHHDEPCSSSVFSESKDLFEPTPWETLNNATLSCELENNNVIAG